MSKKKVFLISVSSVLAVFAIICIILACVPVRPQGIQGGLDASKVASVQIIKNGGYNWSADGAGDAVKNELIPTDPRLGDFASAYNNATKYSVGYGILNGNWSNKVKVAQEKLNAEAIKKIKVGDGDMAGYVLVAVKFKEPTTATVAKKEVSYDLMLFCVGDSANGLKNFKFYLVDSTKVRLQDSEEEDEYTTPEFQGSIKESGLWAFIDKLAE